MRSKAFTLAEALITIGIIGVVAAILLPTLIREVTLKVDSSREANVAQKITKAMENMSVNGDFVEFENTDAFVDVLQRYLKIAKRCDSEHLADCWPTRTVKGSKGETINVSDAKLGTDLHIKGNTTGNVGLVLADGGSIILTYDQSYGGNSPDKFFTAYSKNLPVGFGKTQDFAYSSSVTDPIDYVIDVNGGSHPNKETSFKGEYFDIRSFRGASFGIGACPGNVLSNGLCIKALSGFQPINCTNELTAGEDWKYCAKTRAWASYGSRVTLSEDYWGGSYKACEKIGMSYYENKSNIQSYKNQSIIPNANYFQLGYDDGQRATNDNLNKPTTFVVCAKE